MNHKGAADTQFTECLSHKLRQILIVDANNLCGCSGRIRERAEQIEDGARLQFAARRHCIPGGRMNGGSEKKPDADTLYGTATRCPVQDRCARQAVRAHPPNRSAS